MGAFVIRRLIQAVFTLIGVMLLTFVLFRLVTGDVSAQFVNPAKVGKEARINWLRKHKLDLPLVFNVQRRLKFIDKTSGKNEFACSNTEGSLVTEVLLLEQIFEGQEALDGKKTKISIVSQPLQLFSPDTPLVALTGKGKEAWTEKLKKESSSKDSPETSPATAPTTAPTTAPATAPTTTPVVIPETVNDFAKPAMIFTFRDGSKLEIDLTGLSQFVPAKPATKKSKAVGAKIIAKKDVTCRDLIDLINNHPDNRGRLEVSVTELSVGNLFNSQFFWHMSDCVTFRGHSFKTREKLLDIIAKKAKYSLSLTVPAMALGWVLSMIVSSLVAYYRGGLIDKMGVFICVLGMCVPYLVYMIAGQWIMFEVAPSAAWGLASTSNIFIPIIIAVFASLGGSVRFYRTIILDQVNRDYVRTARAKGVPLPGILFRHVLKNCMLPILTSLVVSIPFLIMGSLLLEQFFGIPGLGSLMLTSVNDRDVPIISGMTFLTAVVYIMGLLMTDILYAVFDPRIRLK